MKQFIVITFFAALLLAFNYRQHSIKKNKAEVIINVNNLNSSQVVKSLEKDFNNYDGIEFVEASLMSNLIILEVSDNNIEISTLQELLSNWGCTIKDIEYRILNTN